MRVSKTQVAGYVTIGAALGAFVALILAPKSGAQTRKDIRKFSKRTVNQLDGLQQDAREQISGGVIEVVGTMKEYVEDGKEGLKKLIKKE